MFFIIISYEKTVTAQGPFSIWFRAFGHTTLYSSADGVCPVAMELCCQLLIFSRDH